MIRKVTEFIEKYKMIEEGDMVAAGVSGGADSLCLLFMLLEYRKRVHFDLVAVHVNHMIREDACHDAKFVEDICKQEGIVFFLEEADVKKIARKKKISEEEAGRDVRYGAFYKVLKQYGVPETKKGKIAVAHHQGDNAETLLFHLFRGTGILGMSGILPVHGELIRPLLDCSRQEIEEYLLQKDLSWCTDATNAEDTYTRNKIRHHILPYANKEINEKATRHLAAAALQMADLREYLENETEKIIQEVKVTGKEDYGLNLGKMKTYPLFLQKQCLIGFLNRKVPGRKDITSEHIQAIFALTEKKGSKKLDLPGNIQAVKEYNVLWLRQKLTTERKGIREVTDIEISLKENGKYLLKNGDVFEISIIDRKDFEGIEEKTYTKYLDYDKINSCINLRFRQTGDFLTINDLGQKKLLKEYFIHEKVPVDLRDEILLVAEKKHILWITGYRISAYYKITEHTKKIIQMKLWRKEHGRED